MAQSLQRGHRVTLNQVDGFADGVAVKSVGAETFRLCQELVDGVIMVSKAEICDAIKIVFQVRRGGREKELIFPYDQTPYLFQKLRFFNSSRKRAQS